MSDHLHPKQKALLESLLEGKLPRNLAWADVVELMSQLGQMELHGDNEVEFVIGSQRAFFKRPHTHSLEDGEISRLRRFLHEAGIGAHPENAPTSGRAVVAIDHRGARIFQNIGGGGVEREGAVRPYDPHGFQRHLVHRKEAHYEGERVPERDSFYEEIAERLKPATEIALIGHGTGTGSALEFLTEYLKTHHSTIAAKIVATEVADLSKLTEGEIEAMAKQRIS